MFLPDPTTTRLTTLTVHPDQQSCTLDLQTTPTSSMCRQCQQPATRVHSRYTRRFADLLLATVAVQIVYWSPRGVAAPSGFHQHHTVLACALGARSGTRFAAQSSCPLSRQQLLRNVRATAAATPGPTIIGVNEWAMRKAQTYGTIIPDLQTHQTLDLLARSVGGNPGPLVHRSSNHYPYQAVASPRSHV